jgi:hypothetical protein
LRHVAVDQAQRGGVDRSGLFDGPCAHLVGSTRENFLRAGSC